VIGSGLVHGCCCVVYSGGSGSRPAARAREVSLFRDRTHVQCPCATGPAPPNGRFGTGIPDSGAVTGTPAR
jgi:hypothetical protein